MIRWFSDRICQCVLLLVLIARQCCGHVVLTYPPPRTYPLDFLNNGDTPAPCGMPRDPSLVYYTDLQAGSNIQVFWDISYPHRGGMFMELLDHNYRLLQRYPPDGEILADDVSQLNYTIQLPQEPCANCTLRIVKRGLEWGANLLFWSCSDLNVLTTPMNSRQKCSYHGTHSGSQCLCDRLYAGQNCQFKNDCEHRTDCSQNGECVDTESVQYPRQTCYCSPGWFGRFCERELPVKGMPTINLLDYKQQNLTTNYTLYHRILRDSQELEVVLVAKSVTWVAVGWRSKDANKTCKGFPVLNFQNEPNVSSAGDTTPESILPTEGDMTPGSTLTTEGPPPTPDHCHGFCDANSGCLYDVAWEIEPTSQTIIFTVTVPLQSDEYFGLGFSRDNLMPDSDIVLGWIINVRGVTLSDRWATGRALPQEDSQKDLTYLLGQNLDNVTIVKFSRALDTKDPRDQSLDIADCIYLLTAKGEKINDNTFLHHTDRRSSTNKFCFNKCLGNTVSEAVTEPTRTGSPTTNGVPDTTNGPLDTAISVPDTTNRTTNTSRALDTTSPLPGTTISPPNTTKSISDATSFVPGGEGRTDGVPERVSGPCDGSCTSTSGCLFNVSWTYETAKDIVRFSVEVPLESNEYFGLGFSEDQTMPDSDIVVGWVRSDGSTYLSDRWAITWSQPREDATNDLTLISSKVVLGVTSVVFSRPVATPDSQDLPLNVIGCIYLLTAKGPKQDDDTFSQHSERRVSSDRFCFNKCRESIRSEPVTQPISTDSSATTSASDAKNNAPDTSSHAPDTTSNVPGGEGTSSATSEQIPSPCDASCNSPSDCVFNVSWTFDLSNDALTFSIAAQLDRSQYFGLGFSTDQFMPDSDIIVGWVTDSGSTYLSDRWATRRTLPEEDSQNDLKQISGRMVNGVTMVTFTRAIDTKDSMDQALNVTQCIYLLTSIGTKSDDGNSFFQHMRRQASPTKYCFDKCQQRQLTGSGGEVRRRKRANEGETTDKPKGSSEEILQPMDCADVIIGTARGNLSRIGDYYTRDRSTPLPDEVYGGSDSLTAALGFEENEFTTIMFRRKLESTEMTDWRIEDELMHVIWARGQQTGDIYHSPESAYESNQMSDRNFYKPDVLKYHGSRNRGVTAFNFHEEPPASTATPSPVGSSSDEPSGTTPDLESPSTPGNPVISETTPSSGVPPSENPTDYKNISTSERPLLPENTSTSNGPPGTTSASEPSNCYSGGCTDAMSCLYNITWSYNATEDSVTFHINATVSDNQWIALAIMPQHEMAAMDVVVLYFRVSESGVYLPVVSDRHTVDKLPGQPDARNNIQQLASHRDNGISSFSFKRQIATSDTDDVDLHSDATNCPFLVYEIGGNVDANDVLLPVDTETVSGQQRVCFGVCAADDDETTISALDRQTTSSPLTTNVEAVTGIPYTQSTSVMDSLSSSTPGAATQIPPASTSRPTATEAESIIVVIPSTIKIVSLNYSSDLEDLNSDAAQRTKLPIEIELNAKLSQTVMGFQNVVVTKFSPGSVVVDFEVKVQSKDKEEVRRQVEAAMETVVDDGTLSGHRLDRSSLQFGEPRTEQLAVDNGSSEKGGLLDYEIAIIVVVVVVVCLVAAGVVAYMIWNRRKAKSNMTSTGYGSALASSYVGSNGSQSHAEMQDSSRNSREAGRSSNGQEGRHPRSYDNAGYETSQQKYQTYVA